MRGASFVAVILGAMLGPVVAHADSTGPSTTVWSLESMMAGLHRVKSASAHFVEHKRMALLTQDLEAAGTLRYVAPSRLEKITLTPAPETVIIDGETLDGTQANGDHYTFTLSDSPEVATLVEGIRSTLAGDLATLRRYYTIDFKGDHGDWELALTPKNARVRDKVDSIRIKGAELVLKTIDVDEKDGDHSQMVITPDTP
jgi:outer membrane lipoprotein-sorting protein